MQDHREFMARRLFLNIIIAGGTLFLAGLSGCSSPKPAAQSAAGPQRYHMAGRIVSVDTAKQRLVIDAGDIPGFMAAMTMGYSVHNPDQLTPLSAEDQITADVVVNGSDVYLENIVVVKKADKAKTPDAGAAHTDSPQPAK